MRHVILQYFFKSDPSLTNLVLEMLTHLKISDSNNILNEMKLCICSYAQLMVNILNEMKLYICSYAQLMVNELHLPMHSTGGRY